MVDELLSPAVLVRERVERYLRDREAFATEADRLIRADGHRYMGTRAPTFARADALAAAWEVCKSPHVSPDHQAGPPPLGRGASSPRWAKVRITEVHVKGATAVVRTEEAVHEDPVVAEALGPDIIEYRLVRIGDEWRIKQRRQRNPVPPPTWIGYLL